MASVSKTATAWEALENAGITGICDVATLPESATAHIVVSCKMSVAGQPDWISSCCGASRMRPGTGST